MPATFILVLRNAVLLALHPFRRMEFVPLLRFINQQCGEMNFALHKYRD